jgi:hypothetical protein
MRSIPVPVDNEPAFPLGRTAVMNIGDDLIWRGQRWRVRGFDPVSAVPRLVYLEHVLSGRTLTLRHEQLERAKPAPSLRVRLVEVKKRSPRRQQETGE